MRQPVRARHRIACAAFLMASTFAAAPARAGAHGGAWLQFVFPWQSIQEAIDRTRSGGYVVVWPGTYRENAGGTSVAGSMESVGLVFSGATTDASMTLPPSSASRFFTNSGSSA